jgi:hypothetical protein
VTSLVSKAWLSLAILGVVMGLLLFVPAGTIRYWEAWVYLAIFLGGGAATTLFLARSDPALLERRLKGGPIAEKRPAQRFVMVFTSLGFVALLVVPALDHRHAWSAVPLPVVLAGDVLVAVGMALIVRVYRENTYASATIEVAKDQKVISTGPLCDRAPSDVRERVSLPAGDTAGPWLLLGTRAVRGDPALPDLAAARRGKDARREPSRLCRIPAHRAPPPVAGDLVTSD